MRLDEKPYPGEPIPLAAFFTDVNSFLVTRDANGTLTAYGIGLETLVGYDTICPDWRERLGRALARMDGTEDAKHLAAGHVGEFVGRGNRPASATAAKCAAIIREEFGIEEEGEKA